MCSQIAPVQDTSQTELHGMPSASATMPIELYFGDLALGSVDGALPDAGTVQRPVLLPDDFTWRLPQSDKPHVPLRLCEFLAYRTSLAYQRDPQKIRDFLVASDGIDPATFRFFDTSQAGRFKGKTDSQGYGFISEGKAFLIFRGTEGKKDWEFNLNDALTDTLLGQKDKRVRRLERSFGKLDELIGELSPGRHIGFALAYAVMRHQVESWLAEQEASQARGEALPVVIAGHSLGGALAINCAYEIARKRGAERVATVLTFGAPDVGNEHFADVYNDLLGERTVRLESSGDIVPALMRRWYYRWLYFLRQWAAAGLRPKKSSMFKAVGYGWSFSEEPPLSNRDVEVAVKAFARELEQQRKDAEKQARVSERSKNSGEQQRNSESELTDTGEQLGGPEQPSSEPSSSSSDQVSTAAGRRTAQPSTGQDNNGMLLWLGIGVVVLIAAGVTWYFIRRKLFAHDMQQRYALYLSTLSYQQIRAQHGGNIALANEALDGHLELTRGPDMQVASHFETVKSLPIRLKEQPDEHYLAYLNSGTAFV